jgi:hypothetical protein
VIRLVVRRDETLGSDFAGVVWVALDASNGWKLALGQELQAAGHSIDWNKVMGQENGGLQTMTERTENYRGYVLVARAADLGARCWAWKDNTPIHKAVGRTVGEAIVTARRAIDDELGVPLRDGAEADAAYTEALVSVLPRLTAAQLKMLQAHYHAPDRTITATQLAEAAGYASYSGANLQYGFIGKAILETYPMEVEKRRDGTPIFTFALAGAGGAERNGDMNDAEWKWRMLPALAHALLALGIVSDK